jgi:GTP-binding protein
VAISALTGKNVDRIWQAIDTAWTNYHATVSTSKLNNWLAEIRDFGHNISQGKKLLKIKYVTQTATCPPQFTFFANHPDIVDANYERYLENRLRKTFEFTGTPIRIKFKRKD